ncbi:MAG: hypothetical protein JWO13_4110 [Acidobacteriales bacterium]|jgi:hypothetical protein|nr:hypothetical protein [Terriglobales bacterium]
MPLGTKKPYGGPLRFALTYLKFACARPLRRGRRAGVAPGPTGRWYGTFSRQRL